MLEWILFAKEQQIGKIYVYSYNYEVNMMKVIKYWIEYFSI